jgi:hypothetical protein
MTTSEPIGTPQPDSHFTKYVSLDVTLRLKLRLGPNGIDCVEGRVIPSADDPLVSVDHDQPVVAVHGVDDRIVSLSGAMIGVDVEE